jgi:hypothetical protein
MYPAERASKLLAFFRDFVSRAPDELMPLAIFWNTPYDDSIPKQARNLPTLVLAAVYSGPSDQGQAAIQPLRDVDTPLVDFSGPMPYLAAQQLFDPEYPDGRRYYWKSIYLPGLDDATIQALAKHAAARPSPITSLDIWGLGGAMSRVPLSHGAFARRSAPFLLGIESNWNEPAEDSANITWAREVFNDIQSRFPSAGAYLNFPGFGEEGDALLRRSFDSNYARLQEVKAKYDPENVFRSNLNIAPNTNAAK